jgi:hypothetical protein
MLGSLHIDTYKCTRINTHLLWHIDVLHAFVVFLGQGMAGSGGEGRVL